jgi:hypothetical protein
VRREYRGNARKARLTSALGSSTADLTITCDNLDNWPTGSGGRPFYIVIGRNTPTEEKILCSARAGNVITVFNNGLIVGRGADETSIIAHNTGEEVEHVFTATDANEANAFVYGGNANYYQASTPSGVFAGDIWVNSGSTA